MKTSLILILLVAVSSPASAQCVTGAGGRTVCRGPAGNIVASPPAPAAPAVVAAPQAVVVAPGAAVVPGAVVGRTYSSGVSTVQNGYGGKAAYNPHTGNAAVSQRNANGVTTTHTSRGGEAKTKNGMGVVQGAGGTTCARGRNQTRCN